MGLVRSLDRVHKSLSEPRAPFIYRAELANHRFLERDEDAFVIASGKGFDPLSAKVSAMGEALERYAASSWGEEAVLRGTRAELGCDTLDPDRLVLFTPDQYPDLKYDAYTDSAQLGWVKMQALGSGQDCAVPALAVLMAYETQGEEPFLFPITSNGLAAGPTLAKAVLNGAYEAVERDAFLATWLNRLPTLRIDPSDHPNPEVRKLVTSYARRGVDLELYKLPTTCGVTVFLGVGVNHGPQDGPAAVVGLGADHDPATAAQAALIEICQVRPALRMRLHMEETQERMALLLADHAQVTELEDHDLLYAHPSMLDSFTFLRNQAVERFDWTPAQQTSALGRLKILTSALQRESTDLLYTNLTSADVAPFGVHVARVVIPDYQPMHFGLGERRLAAQRLYELPQRLGLGAKTSAQTLNPLPHPLA
ncbi:MAG: YcaO-like family protein [Pseudomonadota bacterium]